MVGRKAAMVEEGKGLCKLTFKRVASCRHQQTRGRCSKRLWVRSDPQLYTNRARVTPSLRFFTCFDLPNEHNQWFGTKNWTATALALSDLMWLSNMKG